MKKRWGKRGRSNHGLEKRPKGGKGRRGKNGKKKSKDRSKKQEANHREGIKNGCIQRKEEDKRIRKRFLCEVTIRAKRPGRSHEASGGNLCSLGKVVKK